MTKRVRAHVNPLSITKEFSFEGFGNNESILVDVGAYRGEFSESLLEKCPTKNLLLFEIRVPIYQDLVKKFETQSRVKIFEGDAGRNFEAILKSSITKGSKIETIFINFPDPWFKAKHKKRRFVQKESLIEWEKWLNPDALFIFQTDQEKLFQETQELLEETPYKNPQIFNFSPYGLKTHWEKVKEASGDAIFRMAFAKKDLQKNLEKMNPKIQNS